MEKNNTLEKRRYMAGIDGLRALAVIGVIIYHLNIEWLPGGFLGVTIFFVLSGYLITDLLITEWNKNRRIDLIEFWIRRFKRLLPAFLFMIICITIWIIFFQPDVLGKLRSDFLPSILYLGNWWYIYHDISYFDSFGIMSPLTHLWSLAVEEQFYLFWPLIFIILVKVIPINSLRVILILTGVFTSAFLMYQIYVPGMDPSRVYYGTDTRAFSLLIGATLAFLYPSQSLTNNLSKTGRFLLEFAGISGVLLILFMFYFSSQFESFLYQGGMLILSIYTAFVVLNLAHPNSILAKLFRFKPLLWIGRRSYGIYLWHYPIIILTTPAINTGGVDLIRLQIQILATIIIAYISYQYIEEPIRKGTYKKLFKRFRIRRKRSYELNLFQKGSLISIAILYYLSISGVTYGVIAKVDQQMTDVNDDSHVIAVDSDIEAIVVNSQLEDDADDNLEEDQEEVEEAVEKDIHMEKTQELTEFDFNQTVTIIGDSIIHDVAPHIKKVYPDIIINYQIGRQMTDVPNVIDELKANGQLGEYIIIQVGTNGSFDKNLLSSTIQTFDDSKQIILVTTRVPRPWQNTVNATLNEVSSSFPNVTLVDWFKTSAGNSSYFVTDGVHLTQEGGKTYANLLVEHIKQLELTKQE